MNNLRMYENKFLEEGYKLIGGCDEAGRGPMAGPLVVCGVVLPNNYQNPLINDSKKLSEKTREKLFDEIISVALSYHIEVISSSDVDKLNPLQASLLGMKECIKNLNCDCCLTDAIKIPDLEIPVLNIIKGDSLSITIASASILAKVTRDRLMKELSKKYPQYKFEKHKGYVTKLHLELLEEYGVCVEHRKTYAPVKKRMERL